MPRSLALTFALVAFASTATPALAKPSQWTIDPAHSSAHFSVRHLGISTVRGEFSKLQGSVNYDPDNLAASSVEANIDSGSVNTNEPKRDGHLKSPDFFDVAKYPAITFKSKKIWKEGDKLKMSGDLTLHGVTKDVTFEVERPTPPTKTPFGDVRSGTSATAKINRADFGLRWNKALEAGGVLVGEEVPISLDVELVEKAPAPAKH